MSFDKLNYDVLAVYDDQTEQLIEIGGLTNLEKTKTEAKERRRRNMSEG